MVANGGLGIEEAARLVQHLQTDPESAIVGAFLDWKYLPTSAERAAWDIFELELNTRRKRGQTPVRLKRPWQGDPKTPEPELVAADSPERLAALERLRTHTQK